MKAVQTVHTIIARSLVLKMVKSLVLRMENVYSQGRRMLDVGIRDANTLNNGDLANNEY
jgi:hypothetical protein